VLVNFLNAMRSRDHKHLNGDIERGRLSAALSHLANTSYRLGRELRFNPARETFDNDAEANRFVSRPYREPFVVPVEV
jgi:hypothetical protein